MPPGTQQPRCLIKTKRCVQARIPRCPLLHPFLSPLYWQNLSNLFLLPDPKVLAENLLQAQGCTHSAQGFYTPLPQAACWEANTPLFLYQAQNLFV